MSMQFTLQIQQDGDVFIGQCPEVPGANGQGATLMACSRNLVQAISLLVDEESEPLRATVEVELLGRKSSFEVELLESLEGFAVFCPELPGCASQGDDKAEAMDNIRAAIRDYVEVADELKSVSAPSAKVA